MADFSKLIRRLFPHASKSFIKENPDLDSQLQNPKPKQIPVQSLGGILLRKEKSDVRAYLRITSFTVKLKDEDNLTGGCKALIDCLKTLNLIDDDNPDALKLKVTQKKVAHRREERTEVKIIYEQLH